MSSDTTPQLSPESLSKYRASLRLKMQERFQVALEKLEDAPDDVVTRRLFRTTQQQAERNPLDSWGQGQGQAVQEAEGSGLYSPFFSGPKTGASETSFTGLGAFPFTPSVREGGEENLCETSGSSSSGSSYSVASLAAPKYSGAGAVSGSESQVEDVSVELARGVKIMKAERRPVIRLRRKSTEIDVVFGRVDQLGQELGKLLEDATATRPTRMGRGLSSGQLSPLHPFIRQGSRSPFPYHRPVAPQ